MKKSIAALTILSLLFLSNHCLIAAAFIPELHGTDPIVHEHHHESDESPAHHDSCPHSHDTGPCCTTLTQDVPGILPTSRIPVRLTSASSSPFFTIILLGLDTPDANSKHLHNNNGPPGPHPQEVHLSLLSPRAPPSSASL